MRTEQCFDLPQRHVHMRIYIYISKSPICTWKKYTLITPSGMTDAVCPACMHAVSAICPWATVLVYNNIFIHMSERAHASVLGGEPSWGYSLPRVYIYTCISEAMFYFKISKKV